MNVFTTPRRTRRQWLSAPREIKQLWHLVVDPTLSQSYYPAEPRKGKLQIASELLWWWLRYGEVNTNYYVYGFDRKHGVDHGEFLPYRVFRTIRDQKNVRPQSGDEYTYICILRDKFVFSQMIASLGFPTPRNLAICDRQTLTWLDRQQAVPLAHLVADPTLELDAFCKPLNGIGGTGAFPLIVRNGCLLINNEQVSLEQFQSRLDRPYLIQERVKQHARLNQLYPHALNTMRLTTFNNNGNVHVFSGSLRLGAGGRRVDNWAMGGISIGIDLSSGALCEEGFFKPGYGSRVFEHPDTHVPFAGFKIPYFEEAVDAVTRLHRHLYGIHSIGWDICITEAGPMIIEGNDNWGIMMAHERNFKHRFLRMYT